MTVAHTRVFEAPTNRLIVCLVCTPWCGLKICLAGRCVGRKADCLCVCARARACWCSIDAINKLYLQGLKEIKGLLEEGVLSQEEFETEKQRLYRKKDENLLKQREEEAAMHGFAGVPMGLVGDPYQQAALAMYYYGQQTGGKRMDGKGSMSEEADENEEEVPDEAGAMARDQPLPPPTAGKDADAMAASKAAGTPTGAADVAATQGGGIEMAAGVSGVAAGSDGSAVASASPGKAGKMAMGGKRGPPLPPPMPFMPFGFGGFGAQFPPFPAFPFPPAHLPKKSAGRKLGGMAGFAEGGVDRGAKKRGRPRKNPLPEAQDDVTRVPATSVPPEPPAEDRLPAPKATGAEGTAANAAPPPPCPA